MVQQHGDEQCGCYDSKLGLLAGEQAKDGLEVHHAEHVDHPPHYRSPLIWVSVDTLPCLLCGEASLTILTGARLLNVSKSVKEDGDTSIHPSAWKGCFANFGCTEFSEFAFCYSMLLKLSN